MQPRGTIRTERLDLVPATREMLAADRGDRVHLRRILGAAIPPSWPPSLLDDATCAEFLRLMTDGTDNNFRVWYWMLRGRCGRGQILIGSGGTSSCPQEPGTVMIGYSVAGGFEGSGYATEAVRHMIPVIFTFPGIRRIVATTFPELKGSIRVLEKNGFVPVPAHRAGNGIGEGTIAFVREMTDPD